MNFNTNEEIKFCINIFDLSNMENSGFVCDNAADIVHKDLATKNNILWIQDKDSARDIVNSVITNDISQLWRNIDFKLLTEKEFDEFDAINTSLIHNRREKIEQRIRTSGIEA